MSFQRFRPFLRKLENYLFPLTRKHKNFRKPSLLFQRFLLPFFPSMAIGCGVLTPIDQSQSALNNKLFWNAYPSNAPIEDRSSYRVGTKGETYFAIFDGHGGFQCAEFAQKRLIEVAAKLMEEVNPNASDLSQIENLLNQAFLQVEAEFTQSIRNAFQLGFGGVSNVGACALMSMIYQNTIFVANAGDCRVVLCRQLNSNSSALNAIQLSFDHNARELQEQNRLRSLFPDELDIVTCKRPGVCYVKSRLQPTRTLGDAYLKYPEFNGPPVNSLEGSRIRGRHIPPPYNPPYIATNPEITMHHIQPEDKFLILGSDGVWDYLSNEDAVKIVWDAIKNDELKNAPKKIIEEILQRAAISNYTTVDNIRSIPQGADRRRVHDDITVMIVMLDQPRTFMNANGPDIMNPLTAGISIIE